MRVAVLGLGYIGLPTAAMLASAGHDVTGVDVNAGLVEAIQNGCAHLCESEVRELVVQALASGRLRVGTLLPPRSEVYVICVPTPTRAEKPDLSYVSEAARVVAAAAQDGDLIVLESTVPPGTIENIVVRAVEAAGKSPDAMYIAHCPERVIPGAIVRELKENARVIGGRRQIDAERARDLYGSFCRGGIFLTDALTAELVKVVENTYRDVNLAFANELALLSEELGVDAWEVISLANNHPRVNVLNPGPGVGGHCIPVDPHFLSNANPFVTELIQAARRINERMPHVVVRLIDEMLPASRTQRRKIALLGASYKADVEDTRESPARALIDLLGERRCDVAVYDPLARNFEKGLVEKLQDAADSADALVLITDHRIFRDIKPRDIATFMRDRVLIDTRNFLNRDVWVEAGFRVRTLGNGVVRYPIPELV